MKYTVCGWIGLRVNLRIEVLRLNRQWLWGIGKRVADVVTDYRIKAAVQKGIRVFSALPEKIEEMKSAGIPVAGTLDELLNSVDVVLDCTPKQIAALNKTRYEKVGVKSIYQGGASHALTGHSFVSQANYESALNRQSTRVVSCNTTSIVRRASDPWEGHLEGIMNTVIPEKVIPSHQGTDAKTVLPDLDVFTIAVKASHNTSHLHTWWVELTRSARLKKKDIALLKKQIARLVLRRVFSQLNQVFYEKRLGTERIWGGLG
ncbi:MAG: hypothetical protein GXO96_09265 [Nitrospirae bacterium]|nr:hypothetical protein [Candidatus Manganitrophaceae bacterium]